MVLPGIILAFIASDIMKKEGYEGIIAKSKDLEVSGTDEEIERNDLDRAGLSREVHSGDAG
ncbi:glycine-rich protein, partial [Trifolium medium]|nr:glycine-rich protein [Trifolium medium]